MPSAGCFLCLAFDRNVVGAGYDIEDAIVMNKSSLDRGFGRCVVLRKYGTTMKKYKNRTTDRVVKPTLPPGQVSHFCLISTNRS